MFRVADAMVSIASAKYVLSCFKKGRFFFSFVTH